MSEAANREVERIAGSFRARARRFVITVTINITLAALAFGAPYVRGRLRAAESREHFAHFAACLLDGRANANPGLGMPSGTAERFARRYIADDGKWPRQCMAALDAVAPDESIFLWPSVKQADADLRATVALTRRELTAMTEQRGDSDDIPVRPLLAMQKIRAALTLLARAAGDDWDLDDDAVVFEDDVALPRPAHLPLGAADSSSLELWMHHDGLDALALDRAGISWLRVAQGGVERSRLPRTSLVRGSLLQDDVPWIVWTTPEQRCLERDDRCVRRATGIARYALGATELPKPTWLAGHPFGSVEHSLLVHADRVWLLARRDAAGGLEVREFSLPTLVVEDSPPRPALQRYGNQGAAAAHAILLPGHPPPVYVAEVADAGLSPRVLYPDGQVQPLGGVGPDGLWATACATGSRTWLSHGDAYGLRLTRLDAGQDASEMEHIEVKLRQTGIEREPLPVRLYCDDSGVHVLYLDHRLLLRYLRCDAACREPHDVQHNVVRFAATPTSSKGLLIAVSGGRNHKRIRTLRVERDGKLASSQTVSPCWQDGDGMCGVAGMVAGGPRVVLVSRRDSNLLALETRDEGDTWQTMSGLKVDRALSEGAHGPLEQHRVRKGIH